MREMLSLPVPASEPLSAILVTERMSGVLIIFSPLYYLVFKDPMI